MMNEIQKAIGMDVLPSIALALAIFITTSSTHAAIYKWVDADGKVHYSDQALDPKRAEKIQVAPTNTMEGGKEMAESASRYRQETNTLATERQATAKKIPDPCKNDLAMYRAFTEQQFSGNGRPKRYYLDNPDGSAMTEKEQTEIIKKLGDSLRAQGCL